MKIAQICPYDFTRPGGVKNHIECLSGYLRSKGHEVKIIAPTPVVDEENVYHFGRNRSMRIGGTKIDINIAWGREWNDLKQFLRDESFDIIHFHTFWNPALPLQVRLLSKAKHVTTFHDTPKSEWMGKTVMPLAAKGVFRLMDAVISVSETQANGVNRFSKQKIHIIPNGIDLNTYSQPIEAVPKYQDGKFNLLFLGRLEPRKGLTYALESFRALKDRYEDVRLLVAGDGAERAIAEQFISKYQMENIELLGFVSEVEKRQLLRTADLYLAPALYGESFGIVLLEAMAMGTPIVGFANSGYLNVLNNAQKKYFSRSYDIEGLNRAIMELYQSKTKRKLLSKEGYAEVKKYDWNVIGADVNDIYLSLLK